LIKKKIPLRISFCILESVVFPKGCSQNNGEA